MVRKWQLAVLVAAVAAIWSASSGQAAELAKLKVGDPAPKWSGIIGVDDKEHGLAEYKKAEALVLVFTCNHCPVAVAYEDRLVALQKDYKKKGVQVVAVNVNNIPDDRLDKMKVRAKDKKFNFPYVYDSSQKMGYDYGATCTPHAFLLDKGRKIAYMGAIDDNMKVDQVKTHHLRAALDAVLADRTIPGNQKPSLGCNIKWKPGGEPDYFK